MIEEKDNILDLLNNLDGYINENLYHIDSISGEKIITEICEDTKDKVFMSMIRIKQKLGIMDNDCKIKRFIY